MPLSFHALSMGAVLLLSSEHPLNFPRAASDVWISDPQRLVATAVGSGVALNGRAPGPVHVLGLERDQKLRRLYVLSEENYQALARCPHTKLDLSGPQPRLPIGTKPTALARLSACGFSGLALAESEVARFEEKLLGVERALAKKGFHVQGQWVGTQRFLRGLEPERVREALGEWRALYDFEPVSKVRPGRTLIFEVTIFEFSRTRARRLGLLLPGSLNSSGPAFEPLRFVEGWGLDLAEEQGLGRVLARPQIRTKPGEKARFQSGGEIPIRNQAWHSAQTTWKSYGLELSLEPAAEVQPGAGEVSLSFLVDFSQPDPALSLEGLPALLTRHLESRFDLRTEETTILGTLWQLRSGRAERSPPGLSQVPLLGNLFSHQNSSEEDLELCFAIRPSWDEIPVKPWEKKKDGFERPAFAQKR